MLHKLLDYTKTVCYTDWNMNTIVPTELMMHFSKLNLANKFRYYLALRAFDVEGAGNVNKTEFVSCIAKEFGVKEKTVINNLYKLLNENFIYGMDDTFIYYPCYNELVRRHKLLVNSRAAVDIKINDLNTMLKTKALFATAFLGHNQHISREKRQELTGVTPKTQRKYDEEMKVEKRFNHVIICPYSEWAFDHYAKIKEFPVYVYTDESGLFGEPGVKYVARQTVNTYFTNVSIRRYRKLELCGPVNGDPTRLFFEGNVPAPSELNDQYFHCYQHFWGFVPQKVNSWTP